MALSTLSYFSNGTPGEVTLNKFNPKESKTSPSFVLGQRMSLTDGRVYRYGHFGATTTAAQLVSQDLSESGGAASNAVIAPASAASIPGEVIQPGAIGSRYIQMTLAAVTANQFAGGYFTIEDGTGEGYTYRIRGNKATDDPVTGDIVIELYDRIIIALDATSDIVIIGSKCANLEPATPTDCVVAGVSIVDQAAGDFGWIQTQGPTPVLSDEALVLGSLVVLSDSAAGQVQIQDAFTEPLLGYALTVSGGAGEIGLVELKCE